MVPVILYGILEQDDGNIVINVRMIRRNSPLIFSTVVKKANNIINWIDIDIPEKIYQTIEDNAIVWYDSNPQSKDLFINNEIINSEDYDGNNQYFYEFNKELVNEFFKFIHHTESEYLKGDFYNGYNKNDDHESSYYYAN